MTDNPIQFDGVYVLNYMKKNGNGVNVKETTSHKWFSPKTKTKYKKEHTPHVERLCFVCFVLVLAKVCVSCASVLTYELLFMLCYAITLFCNLL